MPRALEGDQAPLCPGQSNFCRLRMHATRTVPRTGAHSTHTAHMAAVTHCGCRGVPCRRSSSCPQQTCRSHCRGEAQAATVRHVSPTGPSHCRSMLAAALWAPLPTQARSICHAAQLPAAQLKPNATVSGPPLPAPSSLRPNDCCVSTRSHPPCSQSLQPLTGTLRVCASRLPGSCVTLSARQPCGWPAGPGGAAGPAADHLQQRHTPAGAATR